MYFTNNIELKNTTLNIKGDLVKSIEWDTLNWFLYKEPSKNFNLGLIKRIIKKNERSHICFNDFILFFVKIVSFCKGHIFKWLREAMKLNYVYLINI